MLFYLEEYHFHLCIICSKSKCECEMDTFEPGRNKWIRKIQLNILRRKKRDEKRRKWALHLSYVRVERKYIGASAQSDFENSRHVLVLRQEETRVSSLFFSRLIGRRSVSKGFVLIRVTCLYENTQAADFIVRNKSHLKRLFLINLMTKYLGTSILKLIARQLS